MNSKTAIINDASNIDQQITPTDERLPASRFVLFFGLLIAGLAADLITKAWVFDNYFDPQIATEGVHGQYVAFWWIEGIFGVQPSTNPGALFGMGAGMSFYFAIFSLVALAGILGWLFVYRAAVDLWLTFALGLVSGGIIGNLYDRVGLGAKPSYPEHIRDNVRDWILFRLEGVPFFDPWPNFNIADSLLVVGAIMLFIHSLVLYKQELNEQASSQTTAEP
ncbi:signal peptidase II [Mariniblastus fucicola]|uniref:Lipoprotein signal peptidase n=1 Tax=Mariniblastus fucicola TaxID=980251 RepID=A0A5B9PEH7_9BACT|nr:signal peptidase II [Mariniblastus fucicola]QEG23909.1 lipoprotein signal peptidase [Mariniblastus fucicola]